MIDATPTFERLRACPAGVCIIGGGPVGLTMGLALVRRGVPVLLLESGGSKPRAAAQTLSEGENADPGVQHDPVETTARRLGGTANLWGGRCVPFDPIDFEARPWLALPSWPIAELDLEPYLDAALAALDAGPATLRSAVAGLAADDAFSCDTLERWANNHRPHTLHAREIEASQDLLIALGVTATGFRYDERGQIAAIAAHVEGVGHGEIPVTSVILAAGGNESTRLLLAEQHRRPSLFGGPGGPLGRHYMGHVTGQIADLQIESAALRGSIDFHLDASGRYVRRRLVPSRATQAEAALANIAFWPAVARVHDARHGSGPLSAVFLALSIDIIGRRLIAEPIRRRHIGSPTAPRLPHLLNVLRHPLATLAFAPRFLWKSKFSRRRLPGLFLPSPTGRYGLEYHAEHLPNAESRITLAGSLDRLGLPRLRVDLRFSEADAACVVRAHDALDGWLRRNGLGRIEHRVDPEERARQVLAEAKHGNHQIGTVRMGPDRRSGVVDAECISFDVPNLAVVSTAVLPTSGQANPTLAAVQLGLRLADRLARGTVRLQGHARARSAVAA